MIATLKELSNNKTFTIHEKIFENIANPAKYLQNYCQMERHSFLKTLGAIFQQD